MKKIFTLFAVVVFSVNAFSQTLTYTKVLLDSVHYGIEANSVVRTADNGYMIAGTAGYVKGLLLKTDSAGTLQWNKIFGPAVSAAWPDITFTHIIPTYDSAFAVCGFAYNTTNSYSDALCFKINSAGDTLWTKRIGLSGHSLRAFSIEQTADSGFIIVGSATNNIAPYYRIFVIRFGATGNVLWNRIMAGGNNNNECYDVKQTPDGGYILIGYIENYTPPNFTGDCFLVKLDSAGAIAWSKKYSTSAGGQLWGRYLELTNDGFFCRLNGTLMKTDFAGNILWSKSFSPTAWWDGMGQPPSPRMHMLADSSIVFLYGDCFGSGIVKVDTAGNVLWSNQLELEAKDLTETPDTGIFIAGNGPMCGIIAERVAYAHIGIIKADSLCNAPACVMTMNYATISDSLVQSPVTFSSVSGTGTTYTFPPVDSMNILSYTGCVDFVGGINENTLSAGVILSPNPSTAELRIQNTESGTELVEVYDVLGQLQLSKAYSQTLDISFLSPGLYILKLKAGSEQRTARFVKQ